MMKLISGGGSSYADAVANSQHKLSIDLCKEKCRYIISNFPEMASLNEDMSIVKDQLLKDEFAKYMFNGDKGGTIVFSTDVNSRIFSDNAIKNWLIQKFRTWKNRFTIKSFLNSLRLKENIKAWTIGQYLIGTYTGANGKTFNEKSYALNIIDIDRKTLFKLAREICTYLSQESVLVYDATTKQMYFVPVNEN